MPLDEATPVKGMGKHTQGAPAEDAKRFLIAVPRRVSSISSLAFRISTAESPSIFACDSESAIRG